VSGTGVVPGGSAMSRALAPGTGSGMPGGGWRILGPASRHITKWPPGSVPAPTRPDPGADWHYRPAFLAVAVVLRCFGYRAHGDVPADHERGGSVLRVHAGALAGSRTAADLVGCRLQPAAGRLVRKSFLGRRCQPGRGRPILGGWGRPWWVVGAGRVGGHPVLGLACAWTSRARVLGVRPAADDRCHRRRGGRSRGLAFPGAGGKP